MNGSRYYINVCTLLLTLVFGLTGTARAADAAFSDGEVILNLDRVLFEDFGASLPDRIVLTPRGGGVITAGFVDGRYQGMRHGSIRYGGGPGLTKNASLNQARLSVADKHHLTLHGADGMALFQLGMGHYTVKPRELTGALFDVRMSAEFARVLGYPELEGHFAGTADLRLELTPDGSLYPKGTDTVCSDPIWPGVDGAQADLAMIDIPDVDVRRAVSEDMYTVTPSAVFRNVGTADIPWFQVFTSPQSDALCFDTGEGGCEPYNNDQQGLLVWNLYRLKDDQLSLVAYSEVKHAFNSINRECELLDGGSCGDARVAWRSCTDLYGAGTNANNRFLGLRSEVLAQPVSFSRCGSVFDSDCNNQCDNPSTGFVGCFANDPPASDPDQRKLTIPDYMLADPNARYFMETWYLVRDDINIFNSMGHVEIRFQPITSRTWRTELIGGFVEGPVLDNPEFTEDTHHISTEFGNASLYAHARALDDETYRYNYSLMSYDLDRGFDFFGVRFRSDKTVKVGFHDGTPADSADAWTADVQPEAVYWSAPPGTHLNWGTMVTFTFDSPLPPVQGNIIARLADKPSPDAVRISAPIPGVASDQLSSTSFEGELLTSTVYLNVD